RKAVRGRRARIEAWHGASPLCGAPGAQILQRLRRERLEPSRGYVLLELPIPRLGVKLRKPDTERREVFGWESAYRALDFLHGAKVAHRSSSGTYTAPAHFLALAGSVIVNVDPLPGALSTVTSPPIMRQNCRVIANPNPVP